jgi:hypothetical protein
VNTRILGSGGSTWALQKDLVIENKIKLVCFFCFATVVVVVYRKFNITKKYLHIIGEGVSGVEPAIASFQHAARLNPELAEIQVYLSSALACTKHVKTARAVAFKALSLSPNIIEALSTATKVTNFSAQEGDSGAAPLLDKLKSVLQLHGQSTDEDNDVNRLSPSQEAILRFSLFKAYDDNEEYSKAAAQLVSANNVKQFLNRQLLAMQGLEVGSWGKESSSALLGELLAAFDNGLSKEKAELPLAMKLGYAQGGSNKETVSYTNDVDGDSYCRSLLQLGKKKTTQQKKNKKTSKSANDDILSDENEDKDSSGVDDDDEEDADVGMKTEEESDALVYARPLAIVGMPRSGASLLQQMLASHENVLEGDEYNFFSASIQLAIEEVMNEMGVSKLTMSEQVALLSSNEKALKSLHVKYLTLLQSDVGPSLRTMVSEKKKNTSHKAGGFFSRFFNDPSRDAKETTTSKQQQSNVNTTDLDKSYYVIDKQLANTWWAGAFPSCAKVIMLRRNHMDLAFSNFKTNFPMGGYEYT